MEIKVSVGITFVVFLSLHLLHRPSFGFGCISATQTPHACNCMHSKPLFLFISETIGRLDENCLKVRINF